MTSYWIGFLHTLFNKNGQSELLLAALILGYIHLWLTEYSVDPAGSVMLTKAKRMKVSTVAKTQHELISVITTNSTWEEGTN